MTKLRHFTGALPFFIAVFLNAFIDLGHKIIVQNTVFKLYDGPQQIVLTALVNSLILLPFIILLSPAGFLSDKYRKTEVMRLCAWGAVACTMLITAFYYLGWFWAAFAMTFLLAAQSAIYSPAKLGFIKEFFGKERLGEANGVVSALSIIAILAGIFAFSLLFEAGFSGHTDLTNEAQVMQAVAPVGFLLILNSIVELIMTYRIPTQAPTGVDKTFAIKKYLTGQLFRDDLQPLAKSRVIRLSVIGLATFWGVGQVMLAAFPAFYKETLANDNTILVQGILACTGIGIALGSMLSGKFSRNHIETGLLPFGALGIAVGLWLLPSLTSGWAFAADFLFIGFAGGIFIVPLNALIQYHAHEQELGKTLAANNWVQNVVMLSFLLLTVTFAYQGWSSKSLLQLIAAVALIGCAYVVYHLPQSLTRFALTYLLSRRYNVSVQGMKNIPAEGGVLLLGNHISWIDWAIVQIASPRPVRFVMTRSIYQLWYLKWFFDLFCVIPIGEGIRSRKALDEVTTALNQGDVVCLFPEGTISRTGHMGEFRRGFERACHSTNEDIVILPFYLRGLWGSQFSRSSARMKATSSSILARDIIVAFGQPLPKSTPADILKRRVFDLSISSWQAHVDKLPTIDRVWISSAKKTGSSAAIIDPALNRRLSGHQALSGSLLVARRLRVKPHEQNIAVLLPTSAAGALANMAILVAGKTVVNLNYTAGRDSLVEAIKQADIKTVYSSTRFLNKLSQRGIDLENVLTDLDVVDIELQFQSVSLFEKLVMLALVKSLPQRLLQMFYANNSRNANDTAAILFSSGSEGSPKGIMLSHKNIVANVKQTAEVLNMEDDDAIIANLPLSHAFGLTITQFLPLLEGCPMICHADPRDCVGSARTVAREKATIMFSTSTFLRLYCRSAKVHPLMLESLRIVVAGAEKLSDDVRNAFQLKFGKAVYEGYGATETTPVTSVNLPDKLETQTFQIQRGHKIGSVGMPLPGTSCMVVCPDTFSELPTGEAGMVVIGGAQVMQGYLNNPQKTSEVIREHNGSRWYITGDIGYIDDDGYLFIVDRSSRFAKIGGEMISLGAIERGIQKHVHDTDQEVIVVSIEDARKGERLVALYNGELDIEVLKNKLSRDGFVALAIPSTWIPTPALPRSGFGKVDIGGAKRLAMAHME